MKSRPGRYAALIFVVLLVLTGCGKIHFSTILPGSSNVLLSSGEESLSLEEGKIWLWGIRTACEKDYGSEVWSVSLEEGTVEEYVKSAARTYIQEVFFAGQMSVSDGNEVSEEEQVLIDQAVAAYMAALPEDQRSDSLEEAVTRAYTRLYLARLSYANTMSASNVDIDEEDARVMKVYRIFLAFSGDEEKSSQKKAADRIVKKVEEGSSSFVIQALEYSDGDEIEMNIVRDELDREIEEAVFALGAGEMSEILETEGGYLIFYCVDDNVEEETETRLEELRNSKLEGLYEDALASYMAGRDMDWNTSSWKGLSVTDENGYDADFFGIYEEIFS